jgi:hypothetical protein
MSKARITVTFEYEMEPDSYPEGATPAEMVAIDVANYHDPDSLFDVMQYQDLTVTGEVVGGD